MVKLEKNSIYKLFTDIFGKIVNYESVIDIQIRMKSLNKFVELYIVILFKVKPWNVVESCGKWVAEIK